MKVKGIIMSLFLAVALLTIASCSKSSSNDSPESKTDTTVAETVAVTSSTSSDASTESSTTITTIATTTDAETSPVRDEDINSASISAMTDLLKPSTNGAFQPIFNGYELADINNDKIPELIVSYKSIEGEDLIHLFVYEDGKYTKIEKYKNGTNDVYSYIHEDCSYDSEKGLISYVGYGGGTARYILQLTNDNRLVLIEELAYVNEYTHNGDVISESEYNTLNAEFDSSYNWKKLDIKPLPDEVQSTAAPKETYKYIGVVTLNSGTLNLRDFPSTDSNVITQLTNGTRCTVYSLEGYSDWYKIYTDDKSGYVAAQYIKEADLNQSGNNGSSAGMEPIVGTWNLSYISYQGYPDDTTYYDDSVDYGFVFYSDGTACFNNNGEKDTFNYKKYGDNSYGEEYPAFTIINGELVWTIGIMEYHFVKE